MISYKCSVHDIIETTKKLYISHIALNFRWCIDHILSFAPFSGYKFQDPEGCNMINSSHFHAPFLCPTGTQYNTQ